jgi:glycosyltransferase involved in cell wall biosynthesis
MTSVMFRLILSKEKTIIFTHTTPPPVGILVSFICSLRKRKFVYILHDIFPKGLIRLKILSSKNFLVRIWDRLFISALKRSERIVVIGRDMKELIENICTQYGDKIEYIPLWQDDNLISPLDFDKNEFVKGKGLQGKFVIQYSGNMGLWNEMTTIGKAVKSNIEGVVFMFVGGGMRKKELLNTFSVESQKNVIMLPFQSNKDLNNSLNACHVSLVSLKEGLEGIAVPSKIYGILAAGVPVIAMVPHNSEIAFIVKEEKCGYVHIPSDTEGLIKTIQELKSNNSVRKEMSVNSRLAFEKKYTVRIIAERYKAILYELDKESAIGIITI